MPRHLGDLLAMKFGEAGLADYQQPNILHLLDNPYSIVTIESDGKFLTVFKNEEEVGKFEINDENVEPFQETMLRLLHIID